MSSARLCKEERSAWQKKKKEIYWTCTLSPLLADQQKTNTNALVLPSPHRSLCSSCFALVPSFPNRMQQSNATSQSAIRQLSPLSVCRFHGVTLTEFRKTVRDNCEGDC